MLAEAIRDSSLDYRTYWLQGGKFYSRRALGDAGQVCQLPADKLRSIPEDDRKVLLDEVAADPSFCRKVAACMATYPDWAHRISASAKEAIVNELDPSRFKNRAGLWPKLRERVRALVEDVTHMASLGHPMVAVKPSAGLSGLGQWDVIASLVGSIGSAAANVYGANITSRAQESIAKTQANAAIQAAQANMAIANAQSAMQNAQASMNPLSSAISSITSANIAGIPLLVLAIPVIGLVIYFAMKK